MARLNTSTTDILALFDSRWFGDTPRDLLAFPSPDNHDDPSLSRRGSGSQMSNCRGSGSSDRLLIGSGDSVGDMAALAYPPARSPLSPPPAHPDPPRPPRPGPASQQPPPEAPHLNRARSEPLAAQAGGYGGEGSSGVAGAAADGGGNQEAGGALGTWANRQRVFVQQQAKRAAAAAGGSSRPQAPAIQEEQEAGPSSSAYMAVPPSATSRGGAAAGPDELQDGRRAGGGSQQRRSLDDEDELNAAWRWRFARKWQTEQAKQFDPEYGREGGDDEWGDALGYMDALAGGLNLQIARTVSTEHYNSLPLMSPTLSQSMLLDASIKESPLTATIDESSMNATKHIVAVARRAQQLLKQQEEIERQVEQRWESATAGQPWVGQHLPAVTVDSWGRFPFVLVRLLDRSNRHKVLVRGRNGAEEAALFSQLEQEVSRAAVQHRLPGARVDLLGSGVLEWSRERDRCLNVTASKLHSLTDARLRAKSDVSKLAGALAQSSLPVTYKIMVEGKPLKG